MLIRRVIDHKLGDNAETSSLRLSEEILEVAESPEVGIDRLVIRNVIPIVAAGAWIKPQEPWGGDAEFLEIIEPGCETSEVADAIVVAVGERLDVELVDNRVFIPKIIGPDRRTSTDIGYDIHERPHLSAIAAKQQRGIIFVDRKTDTAPLDDVPLTDRKST